MSTRKVKVEYTVTTQHEGVCEVEIEEDEFQGPDLMTFNQNCDSRLIRKSPFQ